MLLSARCATCHYKFRFQMLDMESRKPNQIECEWRQYRGGCDDPCTNPKIDRRTIRFCVGHARQFHFIETCDPKGFALGTPLSSVTHIPQQFRERDRIPGPPCELDSLLEAMESSGEQGDTFTRARFIDTEFTVDTKIVWEIGIVDANQKPLVVAIIDRSQTNQKSNSSQSISIQACRVEATTGACPYTKGICHVAGR